MMGVDWSLLMTWMPPPPLLSIPSARLGGEETKEAVERMH